MPSLQPKIGDVWWAKTLWEDSADERPWVIIDIPSPGLFGCFPISGKNYSNEGFEINPQNPDAASTHLKKICYVHYFTIYDLTLNEFTRECGCLSEILLENLLNESGISK